MAVLAGIIPTHPAIAECISRLAHAEGQLIGAHRMAGPCPHLPAWMRGRQRSNCHVQDLGNFRERFLPSIRYVIGTLLTPRLLPISGANCAIGPPAAPVKIAPRASVCRASARSSIE